MVSGRWRVGPEHITGQIHTFVYLHNFVVFGAFGPVHEVVPVNDMIFDEARRIDFSIVGR